MQLIYSLSTVRLWHVLERFGCLYSDVDSSVVHLVSMNNINTLSTGIWRKLQRKPANLAAKSFLVSECMFSSLWWNSMLSMGAFDPFLDIVSPQCASIIVRDGSHPNCSQIKSSNLLKKSSGRRLVCRLVFTTARGMVVVNEGLIAGFWSL